MYLTQRVTSYNLVFEVIRVGRLAEIEILVKRIGLIMVHLEALAKTSGLANWE